MPTPRRSVRLKKYEAVYKKHVKSSKEHSKEHFKEVAHAKEHSKEHSKELAQGRSKEAKKDKPKADKPKGDKPKEKSTLNTYQKFVKDESKKEKYKDMKGSERLSTIAKAWEKHKRKTAKLFKSKTKK